MNQDLEPLLAALSPDAPSGVDLEYDPDFSRMEKASQETPDQEFGSKVIEGAPADWDEVHDAALSVLRRSKDLRAATYLAEAELALDGLMGFRDALHVISVFVNDFWESVFPPLDADDDNDPTIRINSLAGLRRVGGIIRKLRETPILVSRSVGKFSWTDCSIAKGETPVPAEMESPPTQKKIDAAVMACDPNEFSERIQAVEDCLKYTSSIESGFSDRLGPAIGPNLELLIKELKAISRFQKSWMAMRKELGGGLSNTNTSNAAQASPQTSVANVAQAPVANGPFVITRREDILEGLDKIIQWLERNEPSSPLPMLLKRAKRLSTMSFMDILREISPDGVTQAVVVVGEEPDPVEAPSRKSSSSEKSTKQPNPNDGY